MVVGHLGDDDDETLPRSHFRRVTPTQSAEEPRKSWRINWATITFSQTLGTALGDWIADDTGLGYGCGAVLFGAALAVVARLYFYTAVSRVVLFWAAFILIRPLGATVGDFLDKPVAHRGLALGRFEASAMLVMLILACIWFIPQRAVRRSGKQQRAA